MHKPLVELRERLLRAGVAPRHVRRYIDELTDHIADLRSEEETAGGSPAAAESAALNRLGSVEDLATALIMQRELRAWTSRAPWAAFGIAPVALLGGLYLIACLLLFTGWRIFFPLANTPFLPLHGIEIVYFGLGKLLYRGGPLLVGWGVVALAARQRRPFLWPAAGLLLVALIGGAAQVHAIAASVPGTAGQVHLGLTWGATTEEMARRLLSAAAIFCVALLPYILWRLNRRIAEA